ncbi:hypothetical protein Tco_1402261 [Tanacetum coccineum]
MQKKEEEKRIVEEQAAKDRYWKTPICYDDDEDYTISITPVLSTKEPVDSLIMEDEHLDTIPAMKSDELIKSSFEILVPIPSEFKGIFDDTCDVPVCDDSSTFDALKDHSEILSDSNDDGTLSDDDDFEDIEYVEASPPDSELVSLEEGGLTRIVISNNSNDPLLELPEFESFHFDLYDDPSFPHPPPIPPGIESNFDPERGEIVVSQNVEDDDSFTFVIRTFLLFLTYPMDSPLLLSTGSEDTIFDPGIST